MTKGLKLKYTCQIGPTNFRSVLQLRQAIPMNWGTQLYSAPLLPLHNEPFL